MKTKATRRKASKSTLSSSWMKYDFAEPGRTGSAYVLSVTGFLIRGLNGSKGLLRMHWALRKRYQDEIATLVATASGARPTGTLKAPVEALYARGYRSQAMDEDNLAASVKPILDALRKAGVIESDAPDKLSLRCTQRSRKDLGADWQIVLSSRPSGPISGTKETQ